MHSAPTSTQCKRDEEIRKKWPRQQEQRKREPALFLVAPTIENDNGHSAVLTLFLAATKEKRVEGKFHASQLSSTLFILRGDSRYLPFKIKIFLWCLF
jgi:hypothetical protein